MERMVGRRVTLVEASTDIRYEGMLYSFDMGSGSVTLCNARSHGTEDRRAMNWVPPSAVTREYVLLHASDIKGMQSLEPPAPSGPGLALPPGAPHGFIPPLMWAHHLGWPPMAAMAGMQMPPPPMQPMPPPLPPPPPLVLPLQPPMLPPPPPALLEAEAAVRKRLPVYSSEVHAPNGMRLGLWVPEHCMAYLIGPAGLRIQQLCDLTKVMMEPLDPSRPDSAHKFRGAPYRRVDVSNPYGGQPLTAAEFRSVRAHIEQVLRAKHDEDVRDLALAEMHQRRMAGAAAGALAHPRAESEANASASSAHVSSRAAAAAPTAAETLDALGKLLEAARLTSAAAPNGPPNGEAGALDEHGEPHGTHAGGGARGAPSQPPSQPPPPPPAIDDECRRSLEAIVRTATPAQCRTQVHELNGERLGLWVPDAALPFLLAPASRDGLGPSRLDELGAESGAALGAVEPTAPRACHRFAAEPHRRVTVVDARTRLPLDAVAFKAVRARVEEALRAKHESELHERLRDAQGWLAAEARRPPGAPPERLPAFVHGGARAAAAVGCGGGAAQGGAVASAAPVAAGARPASAGCLGAAVGAPPAAVAAGAAPEPAATTATAAAAAAAAAGAPASASPAVAAAAAAAAALHGAELGSSSSAPSSMATTLTPSTPSTGTRAPPLSADAPPDTAGAEFTAAEFPALLPATAAPRPGGAGGAGGPGGGSAGPAVGAAGAAAGAAAADAQRVLLDACRSGDAERLPSLLAQLEQSTGVSGRALATSALESACVAGMVEAAWALLSQGADGTRALLRLCAMDGVSLAVPALLLDHGVDANARAHSSAGPASSSPSALHVACDAGYAACVALLLTRGAQPDARGPNGESALHVAAARGSERCARLLLEHGAAVDAVDVSSATPLHRACAGRAAACVRLLLERGAACRARDIGGNLPLHLSAGAGCAAGVSALLALGVDVGLDSANFHGDTPLHLAAVARSDACAALLLRAGAIAVHDPKLRTTPAQRGRPSAALVARLSADAGPQAARALAAFRYIEARPELLQLLDRQATMATGAASGAAAGTAHGAAASGACAAGLGVGPDAAGGAPSPPPIGASAATLGLPTPQQ